MTTSQPSRASVIRGLLIGGVLPVIAFALVEEYYGTIGGLIAGIAFGFGELVFEYVRYRKIQGITIAGNAMVIVLGGVSLFESNPVFFKLQPAILIFVFAIALLGSSLLKRPFLVEVSKKQMPHAPPIVRDKLAGMNWRVGLCLMAIGALSVHAAFYWSTAAWAALKGFGAPLILFSYMGVEILITRYAIRSASLKNQRRTDDREANDATVGNLGSGSSPGPKTEPNDYKT